MRWQKFSGVQRQRIHKWRFTFLRPLHISTNCKKKIDKGKQAVIRVVATSCDGMSQCLIGDFNGHQTGNKSFSTLQAIHVFEMSNRHKEMS